MKHYSAFLITFLAISGYLVVHFMELEPSRKASILLIIFGIACVSLVLLSIEGLFRLWFGLSSRVRWRISLTVIGVVGAVGCLEMYSLYKFRALTRELRQEQKYEAALDDAINEANESFASDTENGGLPRK
ncbi:MAG: hypothetical protein Q8M16_24755 [Pirellulaceae bacterium]|nr:hypothetical protein [Pirellulaceae bacterium]